MQEVPNVFKALKEGTVELIGRAVKKTKKITGKAKKIAVKAKKTTVKAKKTTVKAKKTELTELIDAISTSISEAPTPALAIATFGRLTSSSKYVRAQKQLQAKGGRVHVFTFAERQKGDQKGGLFKPTKKTKEKMRGPRPSLKNNNNAGLKGRKNAQQKKIFRWN